MKKNRFLPLTTAGIIVASVLSAGVVGAEGNASDENLVRMNEIKTTVSNFTYGEELIPDVNKNDLNNFQNVLDFEGNLIGYAFEITQDNKDFYVVASNNYELDPIVSFGEGKALEDQSDSSNEQDIYYDGGFRIIDEEKYEEIVSEDGTGQTSTNGLVATNKDNSKKEYNFLQYSAENKSEWALLKKRKKSDLSTAVKSILPDHHELPVTRYYQRTNGVESPGVACGPTTGAMFAQYLKVRMGYDVKGISSYSSESSFINHMTKEMRTDVVGTSINNFISGLNVHLEHNYAWYTNAWHVYSTPGYGNFDEYKKEIAQYEFPVALFFAPKTRPEEDFSYHYVLGVGYKYSSGSAYLGIKDPDGKYNTNTRWHARWNDNNDYMMMIRANYLIR